MVWFRPYQFSLINGNFKACAILFQYGIFGIVIIEILQCVANTSDGLIMFCDVIIDTVYQQ